jgi:RimJ/RimL family protein N-acetyltransferase
MKLSKILGNKVYIRELRKSDFVDYAKTRETKEFGVMCGASAKTGITPLAKVRKRFEGHFLRKEDFNFAICLKSSDQYIGHCRLHLANKQDKNAKLAIGLIGEFFNLGYGSDAIRCLLKFGFQKIKLHKIVLHVLEFNERGIAAYKKCGFKIDGILRDNALIDGLYYNDIEMSILDKEFK